MFDQVSPFQLVVVPFEKVNRHEYYTMSTMGVVHVEQGREQEGDFTELGEWIRYGKCVNFAHA